MKEFHLVKYLMERNQNNLSKTALIYVETPQEIYRYTYGEVFSKIENIAGCLLRYKKKPFSRVLLRMPSNPHVVFSFFACILAGMVPVPVSRMLTKQEVAFIIYDADVDIILQEELELPEHLPDGMKVLPYRDCERSSASFKLDKIITYAEDPAFLIYTSGTTGKQKGVIHAQRNILGRIPVQREWIGITPEDVLFHSGELNWTYTLGVGIMDTWANAATAVLVGSGRKDVSIWTWVLRNLPVTVFATVPSLYRRILKYHAGDLARLSYLRHSLSAGEALKPELWQRWTEITGRPLFEALGMTEISTYISSGPNVPVKPGSPGKPQAGRIITLLDPETYRETGTGEPGLIAVHRSDPGLMLGYHNRKEEEDIVFRGEWFTGGDLAYRDEDGYYWFLGRNNDIMKSFGYRVSSLEVEKVLESHPEILEAAVCEIVHDGDLSLITAFLVKEPGSLLNEQDVIAYCKEYLAEYKIPRKVVFLQELPRNPSGKVLKQQLKAQFDNKLFL